MLIRPISADDKKLLGIRRLDLLSECEVARCDLIGIEQNADVCIGRRGQAARPYEPAAISRRLRKRTIMSRPSAGGEARRARNGSPLPEPSVDFVGCAVQA